MDREPLWLRVDGRRLPLEIADSPGRRMLGLLGRTGIDGAMLLRPARSVHTLGMRFAIDVAHLDESAQVLRVATMRPNRIGASVAGSYQVLEAEAGAFELWGITPGQQLRIEPARGDAAA